MKKFILGLILSLGIISFFSNVNAIEHIVPGPGETYNSNLRFSRNPNNLENIENMTLKIYSGGELYLETGYYESGYALGITQYKYYQDSNIDVGAITSDDEGNIYIAGEVRAYTKFNNDIKIEGDDLGSGFVAKLNKNKERERVKLFGRIYYMNEIQVDSNGDVYAMGSTRTTNDLGLDRIQPFTIKLNNENGEILLIRSEGENQDDKIQNSRIKEDNLYQIVRNKVDTNQYQSYIRKINTLENSSEKTIYIEGIKSDLEINSNNETVVVGSIQQTETFGSYSLTSNGLKDGFIGKLDENTDWSRVKQIGSESNEQINLVTIDDNNNIYVAGNVIGEINLGDITLEENGTGNNEFIAKLDSNGNRIRAQRFFSKENLYISDIKSNNNELYLVAQGYENEGNYYTEGNLAIVVYNLDGNIIKYEIKGNHNYGEDMSRLEPKITINNNQVFILGSSSYTTNFGGTEISANLGHYAYIRGYESTPFNYNTPINLPIGEYTWNINIIDGSGSEYNTEETSFTIKEELSCDGITAISEQTCETLLRIYNGLNGENRTNQDDRFTNNRPWAGIEIEGMLAGSIEGTNSNEIKISDNDRHGEFGYRLNLSNNNLSGKLTSGMFAGLDTRKGRGRFDLSNNNITEIEKGTFRDNQLENYRCIETGEYIGYVYTGINKCYENDNWIGKNTIEQINYQCLISGEVEYSWENWKSCNAEDDRSYREIDRCKNGSGILYICDGDYDELDVYTTSTSEYMIDSIYLNLSNNNIKEIKNGSFIGIENILFLSLSGNKISNIESGTFDNLNEISTLDLRYNGLYGLKNNNFFNNLPTTGERLKYGNNLRQYTEDKELEILLDNNCIDTRLNFTHTGIYCNDFDQEYGECYDKEPHRTETQYLCPTIQYTPTTPTTGEVIGTLIITGGGSWKEDMYPTMLSGYGIISSTGLEVRTGLVEYDSGQNCMSYIIDAGDFMIKGDADNVCFESWQDDYYIDFTQTGIYQSGIDLLNISFNTSINCREYWNTGLNNYQCLTGVEIQEIERTNPYPSLGEKGFKLPGLSEDEYNTFGSGESNTGYFYWEGWYLDEILEYSDIEFLGERVYEVSISDWIFNMMPKIQYTWSMNGTHGYDFKLYRDEENDRYGINYRDVLGGLMELDSNSIGIQSYDNALLYTELEGEVDWIYEPVSIEDMDTEAPVIYGIEDGETYNGIITLRDVIDNIAVSDVVLDGLDINNRTNLDITETGNHTIIATDTSDNESEISFSVTEETIKEETTEEEEETTSGGGGGGSRTPDYCPEGDFSESYYDDICEAAVEEIITGNVCAVPEDTIFGEELVVAFKRAYYLGITTVCPIEDANLEGTLIRKHLAKMISEFAIQVVGEIPEEIESCNNFEDIENETEEMKEYMILACKLGLMGRESDQKTTKTVFNPNEIVNRAQFGTVLSRLLRGDKYAIKDGSIYYQDHLNALKENGIMTIIDPTMEELRGRVMVMMYRVRDFQNK